MAVLIDTHCHLDAAEFAADRDAVVAAARAAGVETLVVPAVERANFSAVADVCSRYEGCLPAFGIHPLYVERAVADDLDALRASLRNGSAVAVGEIGLDGFATPRDDALQAWWFVEQLKIARDFDLPVLLHVRHAVDAVLACLRRIRVRGGIAHAFNGSRQQAAAFIDLGFKLGFGGAMTQPRATRIRALAAELPLDAMVLETDAPDIPPVWRAGGRSEPADVARVAATLAELRSGDIAELAAVTTRNALTVLGRAGV